MNELRPTRAPWRSEVTARLPLPRFVRSPIFFLGLAALHLYLAGGHILALLGSAVTWTDLWKGLGATAGAYYFIALGLCAREPGPQPTSPLASSAGDAMGSR